MKKRCACASVLPYCLGFLYLPVLMIQGCTASQEVSPQSSAPSAPPATAVRINSAVLGSNEGKPRSALPAEVSNVKASVLELPPGSVLGDTKLNSDDASTKKDDASQQGTPQGDVALGDLFGLFSVEPDPDPNEYPQLRVSAEQGDPNAQYRLALYEYRIRKDAGAMVEWLRKAAAQNHAKAQVALGRCYKGGTGVSEDAAEAVAWYRRAAEQGYVEGQYELARMYRDGDGVPQNWKEAAKWFTKAAEQGHAEAQCNLGAMYHDGKGVPQNWKEVVKWLTKAAEQGNAQAQFFLGAMYHDGKGVPQNWKEVVKWLTKAADQGHLDAQVYLGGIYAGGDGIPQNHVEAARWYTKAAEQGDAKAQCILGAMYYVGEGVPQDYKEAAQWYTKAAEQGNADAQFFLGAMYREAAGVPQDDREAVKWYMKAAEQGNAEAQCNLGVMYVKGRGVRQNSKEAVKWFTKAAEQGDAEAQFNLGATYGQGKGVLEDYVEAYKWTLLAAMNGDDQAQSRAQSLKDSLRQKMTPFQVEEGQRRAKEFIAERERQSKEGKQRPPNIIATATGFLITPDGYVLTACHAVVKAARVEVFCQGRSYVAKVVSKDESTDAAVLRIEGTEFTFLPFVSSATVKTGDAVFTLGFPQVDIQGVEAKFTEGSISALSGLGDSPRFFQISVPVQPGNSGGPLVNEKGEVVGLIVSRLDDVAALMATGAVPQTVNYALKSSFILPLLESVPGLAEKLPKGSAAKDRSAAIENARKAVVLIVGYNDGDDSKGSSPP